MSLKEAFDFDKLSKLIWEGFHYEGEIPKLTDTVPRSMKHQWLDYEVKARKLHPTQPVVSSSSELRI